MIPKIIHYCWFGGNPLPRLAKKCIRSWKRYCRGYEIREWNEHNFDLASAPLYVRQAYEAKKWAFVTDYVRLYAMTQYGGIYMDTDVEVIAPLDQYLNNRAFSGFEDMKHIPTGIMACEKGFPLFEEFLRYYDDAEFIKPDGTLDMTTNVIIMTNIVKKYGFQGNGHYQNIEGFALYPREIFCPMDAGSRMFYKSKDTATIHWFSASWIAPEQRAQLQAWLREVKKDRIRHLPNIFLLTLLGESRYEKLKQIIKGK